MELERTLEKRQVTIALPQEIWEILDGSHKISVAEGGTSFEAWVAILILRSVDQCFRLAMSHTSGNKEGNV